MIGYTSLINSYRTKSSVLVNGSEIETFIQHILPNIQEFIQKTSTLLDEVNSGMEKTMAKRNSFNNMNYFTDIRNVRIYFVDL
jgi:hypothetical protein